MKVLWAVALAACLLAGCQTAATPTPTRSATGHATPTGLAIPASAFSGHRTFTGPAAARYGQARLESAYEETVNFAFETGWNPALMRTGHAALTTADFATARTFMTPACRASFDATVAKVVRGDRAAIAKLERAMSFGTSAAGGLVPVSGGRVITGRTFSEPAVSVDRSGGRVRLVVAFAARATLIMQDARGTHYGLATSRTLRYWLVPNRTGKRPFLIDPWVARMSAGKPERLD